MPISRAVAASTALPMVYKPVEIKGRHLVDGGLRSTTNVDVAVEAGAKFVIVVNPLVPYVNDFQKVIPTMLGQPRAPRARHGLPADRLPGVQAAGPPAAARGGQPLGGAYPGVDIILIEPDPNDELMFETNILNFTRRVEIARHGFESVTLKLASEYDSLKAICAKHGIEISATRVRKVVRKFAEERERAAGLAADPRSRRRRPAAAVRRRLDPAGRAQDPRCRRHLVEGADQAAPDALDLEAGPPR